MKKLVKKAGAQLQQGWGKVRRFIAHKFRGDIYIKSKLARRQGECGRCGACCELLFRCPFLKKQPDGQTICSIHNKRPNNCRIFPMDEKCLAERNHLKPNTPCGYRFKS